ncbi:hypothetical protein B0H14DRAFT_2912544 [Mycena olivaceomarginata]|nr:hypothetical protein B0H14DRAFT_2912544 [Mycena olivaceomarginata]
MDTRTRRTSTIFWATSGSAGHQGRITKLFSRGLLVRDSGIEAADAKKKIMRSAGFVMPETCGKLPRVLKEIYDSLVKTGVVVPEAEMDPPLSRWTTSGQELGLIRKSAFVFTISDERGQYLAPHVYFRSL